MNVDIRDVVAIELESQADWRDWKAEEYPEDDRNATSARRLREAAAYVRTLPPDDERLRRIERYNVDAEGWQSDVLVHNPSQETVGWDLSRVGFDKFVPTSPEQLLHELADAVERSWKHMVDEAVEDEADRTLGQ